MIPNKPITMKKTLLLPLLLCLCGTLCCFGITKNKHHHKTIKKEKIDNQIDTIHGCGMLPSNVRIVTTGCPAGAPEIDKTYTIGEVQVMPNFPGGMNALYDYIGKNLQYPASARESGIEGKVIVSFTVEKDGCISDIKILRSLDPDCDEEAIRLIQSMPAWTPGKQGDKPVRVRMNLPIVFKLQN